MRRTAMPQSKTPLVRRVPLTSSKTAKRPRRDYTGPTRSAVDVIAERSGGICEFPDCGQPAQDPHHRFERGAGGVGVKGPRWVNDPVNLLASCRHHNDWVSNQEPHEAWVMGWRLKPGETPHSTPVRTCHDPLPIWLDNDGGWAKYDERAA